MMLFVLQLLLLLVFLCYQTSEGYDGLGMSGVVQLYLLLSIHKDFGSLISSGSTHPRLRLAFLASVGLLVYFLGPRSIFGSSTRVDLFEKLLSTFIFKGLFGFTDHALKGPHIIHPAREQGPRLVKILMHLIVLEVWMVRLLGSLHGCCLVGQIIILDGVAQVYSWLFIEIVLACCVKILVQSPSGPSETPRFEAVNHLKELDIIFVDLRELLVIDPPRIDRERLLIFSKLVILVVELVKRATPFHHGGGCCVIHHLLLGIEIFGESLYPGDEEIAVDHLPLLRVVSRPKKGVHRAAA